MMIQLSPHANKAIRSSVEVDQKNLHVWVLNSACFIAMLSGPLTRCSNPDQLNSVYGSQPPDGDSSRSTESATVHTSSLSVCLKSWRTRAPNGVAKSFATEPFSSRRPFV